MHRISLPMMQRLEDRCHLSATFIDGRNALLIASEDAAAPLAIVAPLATARKVVPVAPAGLSASATSATTINLTWKDKSTNETGFRIFGRTAASSTWSVVGNVAAKVTHFSVTGLVAQTAYVFRVAAINKSGRSAYSNTASATTASSGSKITYSGPIVITHGGTYTGNWQSLDPDVPAVDIRTNEPVIIENSNIRSRHSCINAFGGSVDLTVRNTNGYGLNPDVYKKWPGRFMDIDGFRRVVATNNFMEGTAGIYVVDYNGNHTASQSISITRNVAHNIDGRYSDGNGGFLTVPNTDYFVQFFQTDKVKNLPGVEVAWNQVINDPFQSLPEENINIFGSSGTASSPFRIHDNFIKGAYSSDPLHDTTYTGGGIMLSDVKSAYISAYNNQIVSTSNVGITITSGHDNHFYNNRIISSGLLPDGRPIAAQNVGASIFNFNGENTFTNNTGYNNTIGWMQAGQRNDWWSDNPSYLANNKHWPGGTITLAMEANEFTLWQQKLASNHMNIGPQ